MAPYLHAYQLGLL